MIKVLLAGRLQMLLKLYYFHRPIASSAAVDKHVAQHTHGDFAGPLEVVTTLITQGGGFAARASKGTTTLHRIAAALKAYNVVTQ